jgi:serine/threonine protein kinase
MAFPKQSLLGVRLPIPRQHFRKIRKDLLKQVRPMPGEAAAEVARRARVALRAMGLPVPQTPMRSQGKHPKCQATKLASTMGTCKDTMEQAAHQTSASGGAPSSKPPAIGGERLAPNCLAAGALSCSTGGPWTLYNEQDACFRAKEVLGQGAFGKVLGGLFGANDQVVAMKLVERSPLQMDKAAFVDDEIKALTHLVHPYIVHIFGVIFTMFNVQLFLQQHEMSLHQFLIPRPVTCPDAKHIARCILKGVAHMHATGYVHRDLKPANILIDLRPLAAIISDLGAAHLGEDSCELVTTLFYRDPEIILGCSYKKPSDVWSLGCIFAEVEQPSFFDQQLCGSLEKDGKLRDFKLLMWLTRKICPKGALTWSCTNLRSFNLIGLRKLGHIEAGVLGNHFFHFQGFMEQLLNFQQTKRATAEGLLGHPWLQTKY